MHVHTPTQLATRGFCKLIPSLYYIDGYINAGIIDRPKSHDHFHELDFLLLYTARGFLGEVVRHDRTCNSTAE